MFLYINVARIDVFTEEKYPGFQRVLPSIGQCLVTKSDDENLWLSRSNLAEVKVAANLCLVLIVLVGSSEMPKIWIWPGVRLSFINFPSYPLEQHCHLNDMTGDYSCKKTKRQPLLLLQDWRCFFLFVIAQSRSWACICVTHIIRHRGFGELFGGIICQAQLVLARSPRETATTTLVNWDNGRQNCRSVGKDRSLN